ncbi:hypothetical protein A3F59_02045 [Candidatus Roizmanbacteria bacterium RIFCSPHIGHO2_12_FULL_38_13]|nr:MAG: hypothetical protein A3F59_02045 [Candidatus Roizmanbacteria bacterium RIFCSPHIGHO2_12_FULL_38_13]
MQQIETLYFRGINWLMQKRGIGTVKNYTPKEFQQLMVEQIRSARDTKISLSDSSLYALNLPDFLLPDDWEQIEKMMAAQIKLNGKGIHVVSPPQGSTPEIARGWIDVKIPFAYDLPPLAFVNNFMRENRMSSANGSVYVVRGLDAVSALQKQFPTTSFIYERYNPDFHLQALIFDSPSCEVIDSSNQSQA